MNSNNIQTVDKCLQKKTIKKANNNNNKNA